jgi:hypothetical protein
MCLAISRNCEEFSESLQVGISIIEKSWCLGDGHYFLVVCPIQLASMVVLTYSQFFFGKFLSYVKPFKVLTF